MLKNKVKAKNLKVVNVKKYDDFSGAKVEITYDDPQLIPVKGLCLFDGTQMTMAASKAPGDKYSKTIYSKY